MESRTRRRDKMRNESQLGALRFDLVEIFTTKTDPRRRAQVLSAIAGARSVRGWRSSPLAVALASLRGIPLKEIRKTNLRSDVLAKALGVSKNDVLKMREIWGKLSCLDRKFLRSEIGVLLHECPPSVRHRK